MPIAGSTSLIVQAPVDFLAATRRFIKGRTKQYAASDVDFIVSLYVDVCGPAQLDVEFALTQMVHETDSLRSDWSSPAKKNPAGIGVTGVPGAGLIFDTWADAVEAHAGLILCYALPAGQGTAAQQRLVAEMLGHRPGAPRGVGTTVTALAVKWAADPAYVDKLVAVNAAIAAA